jgi:hypothetical protein
MSTTARQCWHIGPLKTRSSRIRNLVIAVASCIYVACGEPSAPEDRPPDFSGIMLELRDQVSPQYEVDVRIERTVGDTALVHVSETTRVYETLPDGGLQSAAAGSLAIGDFVDVWTTGVEYRSLPPQYDGTQLVVR